MKKKQEENLSLFSNLEEYKSGKQENEEVKESDNEEKNSVEIVEKMEKGKTSTLFTILNGEKIELTIGEIFDVKRFNSIKAVTYSADPNFLNKYFSGFEKVFLIIGIPDTNVQKRGIEAFKGIIAANKKLLKKEQITLFESLARGNQENMIERKWKIKVPLKSSIHCKFYLLESETEKRLILGSANLSNQAFSSRTSQHENIVIFDNDVSMAENYREYFDFLKKECMDFFPSVFLKKAKKIKILNEKNATKEELENTVPFTFTASESEGIITEVAKEFQEKFTEYFLELPKEEAEAEGGLIDQLKNIKSQFDTVEKEMEKEKIFEKGSYEIINDYISSRKATKQESILAKPSKFVERIREKIKVKTAPKVKEHVNEREKMILRENDVNENNSGLYLIEKVNRTDENGNDVEVQETRCFGRKATDEEIKEAVELLFELIESYKKFVPRYDDNYGARIIEAIFYSFTSPFLQQLRKQVTQNTTATKELNIPMFMFIGGDTYSGKTSLVKLIRKMMGIYKVIKIDDYSNIVGKQEKQWRSDTIKQIDLWMREDNVVPLFIDELDNDFFAKKSEGLIKDLANATARSERNTCCFIGNTNTELFKMPKQAERRSYYLIVDRPVKQSSESDSTYNKIVMKADNKLFNDFVMKMSQKIFYEETNLEKFNKIGNNEKLDFLYPTREIFKEYFRIAGKKIPEWFPEERRDDIAENNMMKWYMRYTSNPEMFLVRKYKGKTVYHFNFFPLIKEMGKNSNVAKDYLDALDLDVKLYHSTEAVILDIKKFHKWIGVPVPEKVLKEMGELTEETSEKPKKAKHGFFEFFKRNKKRQEL